MINIFDRKLNKGQIYKYCHQYYLNLFHRKYIAITIIKHEYTKKISYFYTIYILFIYFFPFPVLYIWIAFSIFFKYFLFVYILQTKLFKCNMYISVLDSSINLTYFFKIKYIRIFMHQFFNTQHKFGTLRRDQIFVINILTKKGSFFIEGQGQFFFVFIINVFLLILESNPKI